MSNGQWAMDNWQWGMGNGQWATDNRQRATGKCIFTFALRVKIKEEKKEAWKEGDGRPRKEDNKGGSWKMENEERGNARYDHTRDQGGHQ